MVGPADNWFPISDIEVTKLPNDVVVVERTGGADPSLPPIIYCHGNAGSNEDLHGINGNRRYGEGVIQHSIASGYKWYGSINGGVSAFSNQDCMDAMDALYAYTGADKVLLTGWSMGGVSSTMWFAKNPEKVIGWIGTTTLMSLEDYYYNLDSYGNTVDTFGHDQSVLINAFGGTDADYQAAKASYDPMYPYNPKTADSDSTQRATLRSNKDKMFYFVMGSDAILNADYQADYVANFGVNSHTCENCNHNFYQQSDWQDTLMTKQLDVFSGRGVL